MPLNKTVNINTLPKVDIHRSIFPFSFNHKTTFNVGELIPIMVQEVIPGSTYSLKASSVIRLQTLLTPMMDNMFADVSAWFVPNRLVLDSWKNIMGENEDGPWTMDKVEHVVPHLTYPAPNPNPPAGEVDNTHGFDSGSLADYMGVPININASEFGQNMVDADFPMVLPFRGYAMIVNEFWRDQNLQQPIVIHKDDTNRAGVTRAYGERVDRADWYITDLELGGRPFVAARLHNYFSSCLPAPQRGPDVSIFASPLDTNPASDVYAPVFSRTDLTMTANEAKAKSKDDTIKFYARSKTVSQTPTLRPVGISASDEFGDVMAPNFDLTADYYGALPANLWAQLNIPEATISNLRTAFQMQKYFEKLARGGSRYREYLHEFFGVSNGDSRMQVPEYLGGYRFPLSVHQVTNTSETAQAKLGDLGAMSNTSDVHDLVHMSFSEHGFLFILCTVRYENTFSQGLERFWSRRSALDFYNPVFAAISDQPVYNRQISLGVRLSGTIENPVLQSPDMVFGYAPAWQEYREKPSRVSGEMRPEAVNSLASWHLADDYEFAPVLGPEWIQTDKNIVDRVLAVTSQVSNQVFADFYVSGKMVLPMPVHAIPGLADHF